MQYFRAVAVLSSVGTYFELPHTEAFMDYCFSRENCTALHYNLSCSCPQLLGTVEELWSGCLGYWFLSQFYMLLIMTVRWLTEGSLGYLCVLEERAMKFLVDVIPYFSPLTYLSVLRIFAF